MGHTIAELVLAVWCLALTFRSRIKLPKARKGHPVRPFPFIPQAKKPPPLHNVPPGHKPVAMLGKDHKGFWK